MPAAYFILLLGLSITSKVLSLSRDPCSVFDCQNGGSCTAPADAPSCICQAGFFGEHCEFNRDPCFKFGCLNGGRCTAPADAPYCLCPAGFSGPKCEVAGNSQCPIIDSDSIGICGGTFCSADSDCSDGQICCASACGSKLCTSVVKVIEPTCPGGCKPGYKCELRSPVCPPGFMCPAVMRPTCVAVNDLCGGCEEGTVCQDTGIRCFTTPCPSFKCVATDPCGGCPKGERCEQLFPPCAPPPPCEDDLDTPCTRPPCNPINTCVPETTVEPPKDQCGGCPYGQVCKPTNVVCIRAPCPTHECVAVTAPAACNLACMRGYVCKLKVPDCPRNSRLLCPTKPVPQCVPRQLASCPKPAQTKKVPCLFNNSKSQCLSDRDCDQGLSQRCCPAQCGIRRQCTVVPSF
nr:keratin-associated protein 5-1-like [Biomphalaria glabrata]